MKQSTSQQEQLTAKYRLNYYFRAQSRTDAILIYITVSLLGLCETYRQRLEDPVDFDVFTGCEIVINVLIQVFESPHRVLLAVFIRRIFALNELPVYNAHE